MALVAAGLVFGLSVVRDGAPTTEAQEPQPIFFDDFSNPGSGWLIQERPEDQQYYERGEYHVNVQQRRYLTYGFHDRIFRDFDVRVKMRSVTPGVQGDGTYALYFRLRDRDNHFVFEVNPFAGYYRAFKRQGGQDTEIVPTEYRTDVIHLDNETNILRVHARGRTMRFYINDVMLAEVTNVSTLTQGQFGLGVTNYNGLQGMHAAYDDFTVYAGDVIPPSSTPVPTETEPPTGTPLPTSTTIPTRTPIPTATQTPTETLTPTVTPTWPPTHTPPPGWSPIATIHLPVAHKHGEG
jgi:hypothetical protein